VWGTGAFTFTARVRLACCCGGHEGSDAPSAAAPLLCVAGQAVRYLGAATPHFHNLTDLVREALSDPLEVSARRRGRPGGERHRLPNAVDARPNVAVFQITARLPLSLDLVFTGSLAGVRVMAHTCVLHACSTGGSRSEGWSAGRGGREEASWSEQAPWLLACSAAARSVSQHSRLLRQQRPCRSGWLP
jgi:mannosyl-oligosaccharide glucosidase